MKHTIGRGLDVPDLPAKPTANVGLSRAGLERETPGVEQQVLDKIASAQCEPLSKHQPTKTD